MFFDILSVGQIKLAPNLPTLQKTRFGWIVAGRYSSNHLNSRNSSICSQHKKMSEEVSSDPNTLTPQRTDCETSFKNVVSYEMLPYVANNGLYYPPDQYMDQFQLGTKTIKSSFYVDNFLGGAGTVQELTQIKKEVNEVLKRGCFEIDKWHSNHKDFQDDKTIKNLNIDDSITNALGITWDQQRDVFLFSFSPKDQSDEQITKRTFLSLSSSLFDPLVFWLPLS